MLLEFGPRLAAMEARDFVQRLLLDGLGVRDLLVGDDFRFGHGRAGDYDLCAPWGGRPREGDFGSRTCTPSPTGRSASAAPG